MTFGAATNLIKTSEMHEFTPLLYAHGYGLWFELHHIDCTTFVHLASLSQELKLVMLCSRPSALQAQALDVHAVVGNLVSSHKQFASMLLVKKEALVRVLDQKQFVCNLSTWTRHFP